VADDVGGALGFDLAFARGVVIAGAVEYRVGLMPLSA